MTPPLLTDADVERVGPAEAVAVMQEVLRDAAAGRLAAPPRLRVPVGAGELVFTVGGRTGPDPSAGFRLYSTYTGTGSGDGSEHQLVVVVDPEEGSVLALVVGSRLAALRTGGLGGAAVAALAPDSAHVLGLVGSGRQARAQLETIAATRTLAHVRVWSPRTEHAEALAGHARSELGLDAVAVATAEEAVRQMPLVVCATSSKEPVLVADWVAEGAHVTTVGPKGVGGHELPLALLTRAAVVVTDGPAQLHDTPGGCAYHAVADVGDLAGIVAGTTPGRQSDRDVTVYVSTGLAGSEVALAHRVLERSR